MHVVADPLVRVAQDPIGLVNQAEPFRIACIRVVRVKPLRQQSIDPLDRIRLGVRADLQDLVVVDGSVFKHLRVPLGLALP